MITHSIKVLFSSVDNSGDLISTSEIVKALVIAGFEVETGTNIIIVRRPLFVPGRQIQ
jgi:hypothetical protein